MRSIPRKHHHLLGARHFNPDPRVNHSVLRGLELKPSAAFEIVTAWQGRSLAKAFNLKRFVTVSPSFKKLIALLRLTPFALVVCRILPTRWRWSRKKKRKEKARETT